MEHFTGEVCKVKIYPYALTYRQIHRRFGWEKCRWGRILTDIDYWLTRNGSSYRG